MLANRIAPDGTPHFASSHLGLFCLPMSHKKDARLIWVNISEASKPILKSFVGGIIVRKGCIMFHCIKTLVSMATENLLWVRRTCIKFEF